MGSYLINLEKPVNYNKCLKCPTRLSKDSPKICPECQDLKFMIMQTLKDLRKNHNRTLKNISSETGFSIPSLCEMENGKMIPTVFTLKKICEVYGLRLSDFFYAKSI